MRRVLNSNECWSNIPAHVSDVDIFELMVTNAEQPAIHQLFPFWIHIYPFSFFSLFKKSNLLLLKLHQKSWSILKAVCTTDRQTSQDRSLSLWSKKGIGEKKNWHFYSCCQKTPFCICCEVVLNLRYTPGSFNCPFPCLYEVPSSFPVYSAGK